MRIPSTSTIQKRFSILKIILYTATLSIMTITVFMSLEILGIGISNLIDWWHWALLVIGLNLLTEVNRAIETVIETAIFKSEKEIINKNNIPNVITMYDYARGRGDHAVPLLAVFFPFLLIICLYINYKINK